MKNNITVTLTSNQVNLILHALENEAIDDMCEVGEYSYSRCLADLTKKFKRAEKE